MAFDSQGGGLGEGSLVFCGVEEAAASENEELSGARVYRINEAIKVFPSPEKRQKTNNAVGIQSGAFDCEFKMQGKLSRCINFPLFDDGEVLFFDDVMRFSVYFAIKFCFRDFLNIEKNN